MTAKKAGPSMWTLDTTSPEPERKPLTPYQVKQAGKHLETAIGTELLTIARWAGNRARARDVLALRLLHDYMRDILDESTNIAGLTIDELESDDK
ncbi:hypothetical protein N9934_04225 [Desulfosarcina sp.]|nr:hypothetical protein [Desulfosarcina sp.]